MATPVRPASDADRNVDGEVDYRDCKPFEQQHLAMR
jgi:hypothetical protein